MHGLPLSASDEQILDVVRNWADLLSAERYHDAFQVVASRDHWTPARLRSVILNYGSPDERRDGRKYRVTPLREARGGPRPRHEVDRSGEGIFVWFDLPLNGEWSDLTATFDVEERNGALCLVLDDVHVM